MNNLECIALNPLQEVQQFENFEEAINGIDTVSEGVVGTAYNEDAEAFMGHYSRGSDFLNGVPTYVNCISSIL